MKPNLSIIKHNEIMVMLTLMYYAGGDVKDIWEDEEFLKRIKETFNLEDEKAVLDFLEKYSYIYENHELLEVKTNVDEIIREQQDDWIQKISNDNIRNIFHLPKDQKLNGETYEYLESIWEKIGTEHRAFIIKSYSL